ncbi:MAG: hypothetical protein D8H94_11240 [Cardiobacterium sp.]|jgi:hypothetical protein|uniref:hypothetical protein n=1 Tax=Cardiobacterium sp. Marseille-Q4385 TaxID=2866573 RepID=UPI000F298D27|nr:hypothetical protein [Cardiobacterium sp. Marseille-Q4385]RKW12612.1 MAG: hypothetical protein D8H94_11240 [Cardiobacterium sp.]
MDWNKVGLVVVAAAVIYYAYRMVKSGGYRALVERSRNAPQHWGTFAIIILCVIAFVYLLIRL